MSDFQTNNISHNGTLFEPRFELLSLAKHMPYGYEPPKDMDGVFPSYTSEVYLRSGEMFGTMLETLECQLEYLYPDSNSFRQNVQFKAALEDMGNSKTWNKTKYNADTVRDDTDETEDEMLNSRIENGMLTPDPDTSFDPWQSSINWRNIVCENQSPTPVAIISGDEPLMYTAILDTSLQQHHLGRKVEVVTIMACEPWCTEANGDIDCLLGFLDTSYDELEPQMT
jgi:hypothetical protein